MVKALLLACAAVSVATTVGIVVALAGPTIEFFAEVGVGEFLTGTKWTPLFSSGKFGVLPLVTATLVVTGVALATCIPVGLGAAIYLSEFAGHRARKVIKPLLELLAGVPTVVYGFFALVAVTPLLQAIWVFGDPPGVYNAMAAGLAMGIMIVPTVASVAEDAMAAVPTALRDGALALGSSRLQVSLRVVVPAALSGIVAAFVLALSRAIGETMIVAIAAGSLAQLSFNPLEAMQTMTGFIADASQGDQATGTIGYKTLFAVGSTLFFITLVVNAVSIRLVRRWREAYE